MVHFARYSNVAGCILNRTCFQGIQALRRLIARLGLTKRLSIRSPDWKVVVFSDFVPYA